MRFVHSCVIASRRGRLRDLYGGKRISAGSAIPTGRGDLRPLRAHADRVRRDLFPGGRVGCLLRSTFPPPAGARGVSHRRRQAAGDRLDPRAARDPRWLLVATARAMAVADPPADRPPDLTVIGHQWWWEARYASGAVTANEIHIPTGKALARRAFESADVIHDFWVPAARAQDRRRPRAPDDDLDRRRTAGHVPRRVRGVLRRRSTPGCASWSSPRRRPSSPRGERRRADAAADAGREAARGARRSDVPRDDLRQLPRHRSATRHDGVASRPTSRTSPTRATLGAGVLDNTPRRARPRGSSDPQAIKPGCHMPNLQLTDAQVADLVAYLETLR